MLDLGMSELLIIGVVALIVVGPKDLPRMLRTLGQYAAKARGIAREFQNSMDDAAREADIAELHDVKKGLDDMRDAQYKMQRDMSQSFLDTKKKPEAKKPETKETEVKKSEVKQPEVKDVAAAKPAPKKAARKKPTAEKPTKAAKPKAKAPKASRPSAGADVDPSSASGA